MGRTHCPHPGQEVGQSQHELEREQQSTTGVSASVASDASCSRLRVVTSGKTLPLRQAFTPFCCSECVKTSRSAAKLDHFDSELGVFVLGAFELDVLKSEV